MKHLLKNAVTALTIAITASLSCITASAADSNTYYDVKKAGDYVLAFCGADSTMPKGRISRINPIFSQQDEDCTNFVSQALYYGGYKMEGSPYPFIMNFANSYCGKNCGCNDDNEWFYYKFKDDLDFTFDTWSSTWTRVEGETDKGLYNYLSNSRLHNEPICYSDSDLNYNKNFAKMYHIHRGDVIQIDFESDGEYDHTTFVWCTDPEIRLSYHSNYIWARSLNEIDTDLKNKGQTPCYRVIHTTDNELINKSRW